MSRSKRDFREVLDGRKTPRVRRIPVDVERGYDRLSALAASAIDELLPSDFKDSASAERTAVVLGTSTGSIPRLTELSAGSFYGRTAYDVTPSSIPSMVPNAAAGRLAIRHRLAGPNITIAGGHLSGLLAIGVAARQLRQERAQVAVAGAVEELSPQRLLADRAVRSSVDRQTLPASEGCALIRLERGDAGAGSRLLGIRYATSCSRSLPEQQDLLVCSIRELLAAHNVAIPDITRVNLGQYGDEAAREMERDAVDQALDHHRVDETVVSASFGDTYSAAVALQVVAALAIGDRYSLVTALCPDGQVAASLVYCDDSDA